MYPGGNRRWVPLDHLFNALQPIPHFIDEGLSQGSSKVYFFQTDPIF